MGDKLEELGQGTFGCFSDFGLCIKVSCCSCGNLYHYIDTGARYNLFPHDENVHEAKKCCGACTLCYMAEVETRLNTKLGGKPDWWRVCCCYYLCGSCRICMFRRALKALEKNQMIPAGGAPQEEEMAK
jgi:hypothetical protein